MSPDPNETAGQGNPQPSSTGQTAPAGGSGTPEGFVEKARLDGALAKIQELTLANRALTEQNNALQTQLGTAQGTLSQKDAEAQAKAGEFQKQLQNLQAQYETSQLTLKNFESQQLKVNALKEINRPDLLPIMDTVPVGKDIEETKQAFLRIAAFADDLKKKRETELLAGITTSTSVAAPQGTPDPTDEKGWQAKIDAIPFGSPERQKIWDQYWAWTQKPKS